MPSFFHVSTSAVPFSLTALRQLVQNAAAMLTRTGSHDIMGEIFSQKIRWLWGGRVILDF